MRRRSPIFYLSLIIIIVAIGLFGYRLPHLLQSRTSPGTTLEPTVEAVYRLNSKLLQVTVRNPLDKPLTIRKILVIAEEANYTIPQNMISNPFVSPHSVQTVSQMIDIEPTRVVVYFGDGSTAVADVSVK